jgi:signal transduction histidine kinase
VVSVAHPLLAQKSQALRIGAAEPLLVYGDRQRLEQALLNLVINAHQHSPPATAITIAGKAVAGGAVIQVTDTGPGIPRDVRGRIFDRFYRLDAAPGGSGLGLSIVKAIAESHGGQVTVDSEPGQGTTFALFLPDGMPSDALKEDHGAAEPVDCR